MKRPLSISCFIIIFFSISICYALDDTATVSWEANDEADLAGYRVYHGTSSRSYGMPEHGTSSRSYGMPKFVGIATSCRFNELDEGKTHYFTVTAVDTSENESGYSAEVSKMILNSSSPAAPVCDLIIPSEGNALAGEPQIFETVYSDANGADDIKIIKFLINKKVLGRKSIYLYYSTTSNKLYLRNDSGKKWLGGYAPGALQIISNTQGELDCSQTTVEKNGNTIRINWHITPASAFQGNKNLYLFAQDVENLSSGWIKKGRYTINVQN